MMDRVRKLSEVPAGWVDLQVNGYGGVDFSKPGLTIAEIRRVTRELVQRGTAAYCPTVVTSELPAYEATLPVLAAAMDEPDLRPHLLGIHLEGPFLSAGARGAHQEPLLRRPDAALFDHWMKLACGRMVMLTLAPELDGAEALTGHVARQGVVVSLGHHMADREAIERAARAGATCCTHVGNGIANLLPRHPNPIWAQLADDRLTAMLITDGFHLPAEFVRVALRAKGIHNAVVTSDSAPIAGLPPGEYHFAGGAVISEPGGRITVKGGDSLAGSSATMADCIQWLRSLDCLSEEDLRAVGRLNPLRVLGYR